MNNIQNDDLQVSIIIPTFNRIQYLKSTLDSCLNQTIKCEIVVVDHGSNDGTKDYMNTISNKNIKYIRREKDNGPIFCWIDGILNSSSNLIHLQFDDDLIKRNYIEETISFFKDDKVGMSFCATEIIDKFNNKTGRYMYSDLGKKGIYKFNKITHLINNQIISPSCMIVRKSDLIDSLYLGKLPYVKNTYKGVGPDLSITLLIVLRYSFFGYTPLTLAQFREHPESITINAHSDNKKKLKIHKSYQEVREHYQLLKLYKNFMFKFFLNLSSLSFKSLYVNLFRIKNKKWQNLLLWLKKLYQKMN